MMNQFMRGALAMACLVVGLFVLRSWKAARDRLFLFFGLACWTFAIDWVGLALVNAENRHFVYLIRLLAFAFIIVGIVDKNRRRP